MDQEQPHNSPSVRSRENLPTTATQMS